MDIILYCKQENSVFFMNLSLEWWSLLSLFFADRMSWNVKFSKGRFLTGHNDMSHETNVIPSSKIDPFRESVKLQMKSTNSEIWENIDNWNHSKEFTFWQLQITDIYFSSRIFCCKNNCFNFCRSENVFIFFSLFIWLQFSNDLFSSNLYFSYCEEKTFKWFQLYQK